MVAPEEPSSLWKTKCGTRQTGSSEVVGLANPFVDPRDPKKQGVVEPFFVVRRSEKMAESNMWRMCFILPG